MPILFLGHGSPMNALEDNEFVKGFRNIASTLPKPNAILNISIHIDLNQLLSGKLTIVHGEIYSLLRLLAHKKSTEST